MKLMPLPRFCSQADAIRHLGRDVFNAAACSGKLKPCCTKPTKTRATKLYAMTDVRRVEEEILNGRFPA